jgi:DNA repair protein RadC
VFRVAVGYAAASVVVAHNHPSGDPEPSQHDRLLTRRLEEAGEIMGIQVLDHIIVGRARHVSLHRGQRVDIEDT